MTVAFPSLEPVDFDSLVNAGINRPARYMGHELGVEPRDWSAARVRWALTYPEIYEVGSSNLGHIILYSILNAVPGQLCDRAYLPAADLATLGTLTFEAPDAARFPSLGFAHRALTAGGAMPAVLNAANEAAVGQFLQGDIALTDIFDAVGAAMDAHAPNPADAENLDTILAADQWARRHVEALHV